MDPITDTFGWTLDRFAFLISDFQEYVFIEVQKITGMLCKLAGTTKGHYMLYGPT